MINPNSLRPYHTTLGPAAGPTCSKILAPPLDACSAKRGTGIAIVSRPSVRLSVCLSLCNVDVYMSI